MYDVKGAQAALAAAEAFAYGANALIRSDAAGLKPLGQMLAFLRGVPAERHAAGRRYRVPGRRLVRSRAKS